ncbi:MAG: hypothetical protein K2O33_04260, partial [Muribaculaceae bacterium]|nr:hypothetical protein [Muribaculaceae bacterium]
VADSGAELDITKGFPPLQLNDEAPAGLYPSIIVGLAADGSIAASRCAYSHLPERDDADWQNAGTATMNEAILTTVYSEAMPQILTCPAQQSVSQPGRFRLVDPYAGHSWSLAYNDFLISHDHSHYIYINATDPAKVYVEAAPLGINSDGEAMLYSQAGNYVDKGQSSQTLQQGLFGRLIEDDGELIISMPDGSLMFAESKYDNGAYHNAGKDFLVVINPSLDAAETIESDLDGHSPTEYYNLQGIRMSHPRPGQLVIERRGGNVTKRIVK